MTKMLLPEEFPESDTNAMSRVSTSSGGGPVVVVLSLQAMIACPIAST
jgi:hypothetical protein